MSEVPRSKDDLIKAARKEFFKEMHLLSDDIANMRPEYDNYEGNEVARYFQGKTNSDVTLRSLFDNYPCDPSACLAFMKPRAAAYFLGVYLVMVLEQPEEGADIRFYLLNLLSGQNIDSVSRKNWHSEFLSNISREQKLVVLDFVKYIQFQYPEESLVIDFNLAIDNFSDSDK